MTRQRGTDSQGNPFDQRIVDAVWAKVEIVPGVDPARRRRDPCGAWIEYHWYGTRVADGTGWEIDHIRPVSFGGTDDLSNLQALQWENNRFKGDDWPDWTCARTAR